MPSDARGTHLSRIDGLDAGANDLRNVGAVGDRQSDDRHREGVEDKAQSTAGGGGG